MELFWLDFRFVDLAVGFGNEVVVDDDDCAASVVFMLLPLTWDLSFFSGGISQFLVVELFVDVDGGANEVCGGGRVQLTVDTAWSNRFVK